MLQAFAVAKNQHFFLAVASVLELPYAVEGFDFGLILFGIDQINRAVFEGVCGTPAVVVGL